MRRLPERSETPSPAIIAGLRGVGGLLGKAAWRIRFRNRELIPPEDGRGLVIAANHQTYLDPYWICLPIYRPLRFMAWDRAFDWVLVGRMIRKLGAFPVNIERGAVSSMKESLRVLSEGSALVVFPEGSRSFGDGRMQKFKPGAARLALAAGVPVLPVTIRGGNKVWPRGAKLPRPGRVEIIYHDVIETEQFLKGESERRRSMELTETLQRIISSEL